MTGRAITAWVAVFGTLLAAGQKAPVAPVFTAQQAGAGKGDYAKHCASCHMSDLTGNIEIPPLAGKPFMETWGRRSTKELFDYLSTAMPYGAPPLSAESYLSITAYILQSNGAAAGADTLSALTVAPIGSLTSIELEEPRELPAAAPSR